MPKTVVVGEIHIDVDDLKDMNTSELVKLCRMIDSPAHRGVRRDVLISILKGKKRRVHNAVDEYREIITKFLKDHWSSVKSQVDLKCSGDCFDHTDFQVITCWKMNREILERDS